MKLPFSQSSTDAPMCTYFWEPNIGTLAHFFRSHCEMIGNERFLLLTEHWLGQMRRCAAYLMIGTHHVNDTDLGAIEKNKRMIESELPSRVRAKKKYGFLFNLIHLYPHTPIGV